MVAALTGDENGGEVADKRSRSGAFYRRHRAVLLVGKLVFRASWVCSGVVAA
jgi:hypothetical protein